MGSNVDLPVNREVVWKQMCIINSYFLECILEFSRSNHKFYVMVYDLKHNRTHSIEMFRQQANKLLRVCDSDLEKVMRLLDFQNGQMYIKN